MAYGTIKSDIVQSSTAGTPPQFNDGNSVQIGTLCRAWVNFNGTGTVAIRSSFNVSSITDNGTGNYTVNFTTAMPDANYSIVATSIQYLCNAAASPTTSGCTITVNYQSSTGGALTAIDDAAVRVAIFR